MSSKAAEAEQDFFLTGVRLYLDVSDSVAEFRRVVGEKSARAVRTRFADLEMACHMEWALSALIDYASSWAGGCHVGKQLAVKDLGNLRFCLSLYREHDRVVYNALVSLSRK